MAAAACWIVHDEPPSVIRSSEYATIIMIIVIISTCNYDDNNNIGNNMRGVVSARGLLPDVHIMRPSIVRYYVIKQYVYTGICRGERVGLVGSDLPSI